MGRFNARPRFDWATDLRATRPRRSTTTALAASEAIDDVYYQPGLLLAGVFFAITHNDGDALRANTPRVWPSWPRRCAGTSLRVMLLADQMIATIEGRLVEAEALSIEQFAVWRKAGMPEAITYRATEQLAVRREQDRLAEIIPNWSAFVEAPAARSIVGEHGRVRARRVGRSRRGRPAAGRRPGRPTSGRCPTKRACRWPWPGGARWRRWSRPRGPAEVLHELVGTYDGLHVMTGGITCGPAARLLRAFGARAGSAGRRRRALRRGDRAESIAPHAGMDSRDVASTGPTRSQFAASTQQARELVESGDAAIDGLALPRLQRQSAELQARLDS